MALTCDEAGLVRQIVAVVERMQPALKQSPLSADNRMAGQVRHALDLLVGGRSGTIVPTVAVASAASAAAYIEPLTTLFMDFVRSVAWQAAALAFERGRGKTPRPWTLNSEVMCGITLLLGADLHQLKQFMVGQATALETHLAQSKDSGSVATSATSVARSEPVPASIHEADRADADDGSSEGSDEEVESD